VAQPARRGARCEDEKKQLIHRLPPAFVLRILASFNAGDMDPAVAAEQLGVGKTRLDQLWGAYLRDRSSFRPGPSGGARRGAWPAHVRAFLEEFLPLSNPPNYQLACDELQRLHGLVRARSSVEAHVKAHCAHLVPRRRASLAPTADSAARGSANFGSTTAPFTSGGPPLPSRRCS